MTSTPRILVIDDDPITRLLVQGTLGKNGFEIITAENGAQGLELYASCAPDLVLLDVMMPEMDGFECLRRLLLVEQVSQVPVVMMTAVEDIHYVEQAYQLGAIDFIGKPIQWLLLPFHIRYVLRAHQTKHLLIKQQKKLQQSEERLRLSLSAAKQGLWDFNVQTGYFTVNAEYLTMLGYDSDEYTELTCEKFSANVHPDDIEQVRSAYLNYIAGNCEDFRAEFRYRCADGSWIWIISIGSTVKKDAQGQPLRMLGIHTDITERKAATAKIEYLARHDPLTNLPNRTLLHDRFDQAIALALRNNTLVALMFLDLDRFKQINDTLGHDAGDRLLKGIAERLCHCVREVDTVCRQGGDEFIIILTDLPEIDIATHIALKILDQLHQPFAIEGVMVSTSFSIGISVFPDDGMNFHGLLNKADTAMYVAKSQGRNTFRFFCHDMNQASMERMQIESGLRQALKNQEFQLYYQPLYTLSDNNIIGAEALLRWQPHDGPSVSPNKFIPIAEDNGLIIPIGNWVLQQACLQNRLWHDAGLKLLITVNISAVQFKRGNLVDSVKSALEVSGLDPQYLELELTESLLIVDADEAITIINEISALGVSFAIDDFGTGYSSLSYLRQFAVNKLKIDQSFIKELSSGRSEDYAIVQAILLLGETLGLQTIAEGVETLEQVEQLARLGCKNGQGFFWNHAMLPEDFEALFKNV